MNTKADVTLLNLNMLCVRYVDRSESEVHLPLGPLYLAHALEKAGYAVDFRDYQLVDRADKFSIEALRRFLSGAAPIVFVSCMANLLPYTLLALERYKLDHPDAFLALGGVGAAGVERQVLDLCPWIDAISVGEGEVSGPALVRAAQRGRGTDGSWDLCDVPGVLWRQKGAIFVQPAAARLRDLEAIAPAWHLVDLSRYAGINIITSRGCPFPCSFCSVAPVWGRKPVLRRVEGIVAEMEWLHERAGCELFLFQDEYFLSSSDRVRALCEAMQSRGLRFRWKAFGRIDQTDEPTMRAMARGGMYRTTIWGRIGFGQNPLEGRQRVRCPTRARGTQRSGRNFSRCGCVLYVGISFRNDAGLPADVAAHDRESHDGGTHLAVVVVASSPNRFVSKLGSIGKTRVFSGVIPGVYADGT